MNSIPLIKGNTPQEINTSIISLKKALAALEGNDKDVQNKIKQINELINGINSHLDTIDGQITDLQPIDIVTSGDMRSVTSGAVASALDVPTDAVLHYSFDEVPDYPDGTAVLKQIGISSTSGWTSSSDMTITVENNALKIVSAGIRSVLVTNAPAFYASNLSNKLVKIKFRSSYKLSLVRFQVQTTGYPTYYLNEVSKNGNEYVYCGYIPEITAIAYLIFATNSPQEGDYVLIEEIYVGDGSYTTPIIDNANGQNNGTNNGGLAVKGVSGKGVRFSGKGVIYPNNNIGEKNKTFSCWFSIDNIIPARNIFCKNYNNGFIVIVRNVNNVSTLSIFYYSAGYTNIAQLTANTVYHLVIICGETDIKVYLNGVLVKTINVTVVDNINRLFIGAFTSNASNGFYGTIDDFLVFNRALSETEVKALYLNRANTPKYYSWADWKLNQMENANRSVIAETRSIEESGEEER